MDDRRPRLALFIDADNVKLQEAPGILDCLSGNWDVSYRRAYGLNLQAGEEILRRHSIVPVEVLNNTSGKNATDFALVVDAMEELCLGPSEAICIVSADGDFTRLVQRIRERGKTAIIFGKGTTAAALRGACTEFHAIESLRSPLNTREKKATPKRPAPASLKTPPAETERRVRKGLEEAFLKFSAGSETITLDRFGQFLKQSHPKLAPPKFGLRRLKPYLERIGGFEVQPIAKSDGVAGKYRIVLPPSS